MFENQIATLTTILKDKDIHNYMGDTFWNIIKAVSLGDIGALFDSSIDIKNMLFHAPSVLFWDKMQRYMFGTFRPLINDFLRKMAKFRHQENQDVSAGTRIRFFIDKPAAMISFPRAVIKYL